MTQLAKLLITATEVVQPRNPQEKAEVLFLRRGVKQLVKQARQRQMRPAAIAMKSRDNGR
jgi:hypothetical protein